MWTRVNLAVAVLVIQLAAAALNDRPRVRCDSGHLRLEGGTNRNISLSTRGSGAVNINGVDVAGSLTLVSQVRPQLQSLHNSDLGYLVSNLSQVARTVASNTWISTNVNSLNTSVTKNTGDVATLVRQVSTLRSRLDPLVNNVTRLSSQVSLLTPDAAQRVQALNQLITNLQQTTNQNQEGLRVVQDVTIAGLRQQLAQLQAGVAGIPNLRTRIQTLENSSSSTSFPYTPPVNATTGISYLSLTLLHREVAELKSQLQRDECASGPCQHGGLCIDGYLKHTCICDKTWRGNNCDLDVNECYEYQGSDLGCQNGARCINTPGSYRCECTAGWYGVRCSQKSDNCSTNNGAALCGGHGVCIPSSRGQHSYTCICDEGWKPGTSSPACVDVDECASTRPHCSRNPQVHCVNYPGGFACGPCPQGYSGDGFVCNDVDECQVNNGGCSPFSVCYNTFGGRRCGPCQPGFTGNGLSCTPAMRPCQMSPCHPMAQCVDNPVMSATNFQCICPPGYIGNGIGPQGCSYSGGGQPPPAQPTNPCATSPCVNGGTCTQAGYSFSCTCMPGYTGYNCGTDIDECASNPCMHGGTCSQGLNTFTCNCPASHTGDRCQTEAQQCGGRLIGTEGTVVFPGTIDQMYNHNQSCSWSIIVPRAKVVNITFSYFHMEGGGCFYDWLQINDGGNMLAPLLGRYCGEQLPGNNGTVISTHNSLYLWFRSDHSVTGYGFNFTWNATEPDCGGDLPVAEYGTVKSPGYPSRYPTDRDCYWTVQVPLGKKIKFHFPTLQMEHHSNCTFDFLEVRDGLAETSPSLGKYCSTVTPAPLTTSGPEALLHFHSDNSFTDTGFMISYSAEPGIPGCGGLLSEESGEFSAPTLSDRYHHNLRCEWLIRVHPQESVTLNFTEFHLEHHHACVFDYIEVRDGGSADSPLITRACGRTMPEPISSSGNQLFVTFRSDYSVARSGFRAVYQVACGGDYIGETGILRSPYSPDPYPANRECVYLISQPPGKAIVLNFTFFDIEPPSYWSGICNYDYVEIRDGRRPTSPLLGRYCGPETHRPDPVLATHNYMWIKFVTDHSIHNHGFVANYTTIDTSCGGVLTDLTGIISSPNSPQNYPANLDCRWVLDLPPGYVIQLTWNSFALEQGYNCRYDYIEIYDNSTVPGSGGMMGERFCGSNTPPIMTSSDNLVTIHFHSDHNFNHDGFTVLYHGLDATRACGGHYHTQTGVITSPDYPEFYPHNRICEWTITVARGQQIRLVFDEKMFLEETDHCSYDYLEIRNGRYATSPLLTKVCSYNKTVPEILSHSNQLYLKFGSDSSVSKKGFKVMWDGLTTGCGGLLTGVTGEIISPGYPANYPHRTDCYWTIRVAQGSSISLHFTDLDMEEVRGCFIDYVEVRDGDQPQSALLGRYCSSNGFISLNSTSNTLWLRFRSDSSVNGRGFKAQYHTNCNRVIRGHRGIITTPNYPNPYPHNRNCTWIIQAPLGNSINASFSEFVLEPHMNYEGTRCYYDYVEVREAVTVTGIRSMLGHYCRNIPPPISTTARHNILEIQFVSDFSVAENGFRLEWIVHGCGGHLTKSSGSFTSPNYPDMYPSDTICEWSITTAPATKILITVHDFDLEGSGNCIYDALRIYGGEDDSAPRLANLCHHQQDAFHVTTQGNHAFVTIRSDQSVRGRGFNITYSTLPDGCGGLFTAPHGLIHSPNYPQSYEPMSDCEWVIQTSPQHVVELNFTHFEIEPADNCTYDNVTVFDGPDIHSPQLLHICGRTLPQTAFVRSTGNTLTVRLLADDNMGGKGFQAQYNMGCGARLEVGLEGAGELVSPHYPSLYSSSLNCSWYLHAPQGNRIYLHIVHMNMHSRFPSNDNCTYDYVSVREGTYSDSPEVGRYCGTSSPRPLISQTEYLTVSLVSRYGFFVSFRAVYSVLTSSCGGDLTSVTGELTSPHYPDPYSANLECVWTIHAGPGNRVQLNFAAFDIDHSQGCNLDYLEVHETNAAGPLLLHNCSSDLATSDTPTLPPTITARDTLWIKFRSDGVSAGARGFLASYSLVYGGILRGSSGEVVSPMYPHKYMGREDITWRIIVPRRKYISITFLDLDIEGDPVEDACFASLTFYNGWSRRWSPVLGTYCGHRTPEEALVSSRRFMYVHFNANHLHKGSRFRFRYEAVDTRGTPGIYRRDSSSNCTFLVNLNSTGSVITHPNYPNKSRNNVDCTWEFQASPHERVAIIVYYRLEESSRCGFDRIDIYDGVGGTRNWNRTHRLCRRDQLQRGGEIVSSGRFLKFHYTTDSSFRSNGFRAYAQPVCGGYMKGPEGVIKTALYPVNYPPSQNCLWTIKVGIGRTIRLEFDEFKIANSTPTCGGDYLLIRNGGSLTSPFLGTGKFCGRGLPDQLESSSNSMTLSFVSDAIDFDKGFKLRYYEQAASCGGNHRLTEELTEITLESPNPPQPHSECAWTVMGQPEKSLSLHFISNFEFPDSFGSCDQAYVEVRDGGTLASPLLGRFCGTTLPDTQHSTGDAIYVRYFNNGTSHHAGFKAKISSDTCGGTYGAWPGGILTTPDYPTPYTADLNCTWKIMAPVGHYVSLHFLQVEIYSLSDNCSEIQRGRLQIRDKNATGEVLTTLCGSPDNVEPVNTPSNVAYITFQGAANPSRRRGLRIMYNMSAEECGGEVSGSEGFIQSPGYPHGYPGNRICVYIITGPPGRKIQLHIIDLDMPARTVTFRGRHFPSCGDYIQIFNGRTPEAPVIERICGREESHHIFNSSMNTLLLRFRTLGGSQARGFRAHWTTEDLQECGGDINLQESNELAIVSDRDGPMLSKHCIWTANNPTLHNSSFVLELSHLQLDNYCSSTIIVEGVSSDGEVRTRKKLCGNSDLSPILVPDHTIRITFNKVTYRLPSWNLTVNTSPCGGVVHGPQDVITSPNFPANYPNNIHCVWALRYSQGEQIDFAFTSFNLEASIHHDFVKLYNGPRFSSPLIGSYSGTGIAMNVGRSMTNNLLLEFQTDGSTARQGFRATATRHARGCGGLFHGRTGNFSSFGFPNDYPANAECEWEIDTPAGYHALLTFTDRFDIETSDNCQNDYVQVLHAEPSESFHGPLRWVGDDKLCGKQKPQEPIVSFGARVKLLFHTNSEIQGEGFQVSWDTQCGMNYTSPRGYIVSPGHPGEYPKRVQCFYRIIAEPQQYVTINFLSFDVEDGYDCQYDSLSVTEERARRSGGRRQWGRTRRTNSWGPYCGEAAPPSVLTTRGTTTLNLTTDSSIQKAGFVANYSIQVCGGNMSAPAILTLPTVPIYHNSMNCVWDITAPPGKVAHFKFQQLILEANRQCTHDSISIYDGHTSSNDHLISRLCGNHTNDLPVVVAPNQLTRVVFRSDHSVMYEGFTAALEFTYACDGNVNISYTSASETIRSPDNDNDGYYEPMLACRWLVIGMEDQVVTLTFTRLTLEPPGANDTEPCPYDKVEIYDGPSRKSPLISIHCNSSVPAAQIPPVSASSNVMLVYFKSDSANQFPGFTATLTNTPHPCGSSSLQATNDTQVLQSPGYPTQYPVSIRCRWVISAPETDMDVHLEFNDFHLESSTRCTKDQLYISDYDANAPATTDVIDAGDRRRYYATIGGRRAYFSWRSTLVHGYCGSTFPIHLISYTNAVELKFVSDSDTTDAGFRLHYSIATCNRTFTATSGSVGARGRQWCMTTIQAPEGSFVNLYFNSFHISNRGQNCTAGNTLRIYDGATSSAPLLVSACGWRDPSPVYSTGNVLRLEHTPQGYGRFSITYTTSTTGGGCGGSLFIRRLGYLTSPGYPNPSSNNLDCTYTVAVPSDHHAAIWFYNIDFASSEGCNSTYLEVYDMNVDGQATLFNTICGTETMAAHLAPSSRLALRYVTGGGNITGEGWKVRLRAGIPHEDTVFDNSDETTEDD